MNLKTAESYVFGYRQGKPNDPPIEKAHRLIEQEADLARRLAEQVAFDGQLGRALQAITPPSDLRQRVLAKSKQGAARPQFAVASYIAAFCGLATILSLLVIFALDRQSRFPGSESVAHMVNSANSLNSLEMVPTAKGLKAGDLVDWFYMRGFETYKVPSMLAEAPALGSRLFTWDGNSVAQVAVEWHDSVLYLFRADSFGIDLPPGEVWHQFRADDWAAAIHKEGNTCTVIAFRGSESEMKQFLKTLTKP